MNRRKVSTGMLDLKLVVYSAQEIMALILEQQLSQPEMRATNSLVGRSGKSLDELQPRLIAGETKQAYLTSRFKDGRTVSRSWPQRMPAMQLSKILRFVTNLFQ
jgi:hypothetical protein